VPLLVAFSSPCYLLGKWPPKPWCLDGWPLVDALSYQAGGEDRPRGALRCALRLSESAAYSRCTPRVFLQPHDASSVRSRGLRLGGLGIDRALWNLKISTLQINFWQPIIIAIFAPFIEFFCMDLKRGVDSKFSSWTRSVCGVNS